MKTEKLTVELRDGDGNVLYVLRGRVNWSVERVSPSRVVITIDEHDREDNRLAFTTGAIVEGQL